MSRAFTIVELLVVVTIITVLLALLAPALDKAVTETQLVRCLANQHVIGQGLALYFPDFHRRYPMMDIWWDLLGDKGARGVDDVTERPLNVYLGYTTNRTKVPVAECPSDMGDPGLDEDPSNDFNLNSYKNYGSSYVQAWHLVPNEPNGIAATKIVFGYNGNAGKHNAQYTQHRTPWTSVKHTSLVRPDNKALSMDWPWHNNRYVSQERLRWHKTELVERIFSTLFADGHADLLNMDKSIVDPDPRWGSKLPVPYDPSRAWW